jgi:peptidoglycan hydrolase-like protein with peptidoglycan-binding domain
VRRGIWFTGAAAAVLGIAGTAAVLARDPGPDQPPATLPPATAKVTRTTLVETKTLPGTLGYGDPVPIRPTGGGTITWLAAAGSTVERGTPLFKIDERPVVALYGPLPLYRLLQVGTVGADVRQLEANLAALGYMGLTVDDTYTAGTARVVRSWQGDLGLPKTGVVEPGQVVFTAGPVRIAQDAARIGDRVDGGTGESAARVLSYTGTAKVVTVDLDVADRPLAVRRRAVTVTIPGAGTVKGTISAIGNVATAKEDQAGGATGASGPAAGGSGSTAADATVQVRVSIGDQAALGSLDTAPVDVDLTSAERKDVLAVPVAALLALPDGGTGVEVVDQATTHIVKVKAGMFAAGQVEISGNRIAPGVTVGVAK